MRMRVKAAWPWRKQYCCLTEGSGLRRLLYAVLMGTVAAAAQGLPPAPAATAALEQRLLVAFQADQQALLGYTHREHVVTRKDQQTDARTLSVWYVHGRAVSETIALDNRTLSNEELSAEHARACERAAAAAQRQPPRLGVIEFGGHSYPFARLAHDYRYTDPHTVVWNGRPTWVYEAVPNPDVRARSHEEYLLLHSRGEVYVDAEDQHVVRMAIQSTGTVRYLLGVLASIHHADFLLELERRQPGVWLPKEADFHLQATVLLFHHLTRSKQTRYYDYSATPGATANPCTP